MKTSPSSWRAAFYAGTRILRRAFVLLLLLVAARPASAIERAAWQQRLTADWVLAEEVALLGAVSEPLTTQADAAGGCDGVKNGEWGFHTDNSENPWWQVDLGKVQAVGRVEIWNRREGAERASRIKVLLSDDGKDFREVYQHDGTVFREGKGPVANVAFGCGREMRPHQRRLGFRQLQHEIGRESVWVSANLLVESLG